MDKGFSLIELIIVIAIMGIITVIAMPNYTAIQSKAKLSALNSAGTTIQTAIESYSVANGNYPSATMDGGQLAALLLQSGDLKTTPKNPYTGSSFSSADTSGKIQYSYDSGSQTYSLKLYGESTVSPSYVLTN